MSRADGDISGLYKRIRRWRENNSSIGGAHGLIMLSQQQETPSSISSMSGTATISSSSNSDSTKRRRDEGSMKEVLPSWMDSTKAYDSMSTRPKRRSAEVVRDLCKKKIDKHYYDNRYKISFKAATQQLRRNQLDDNSQGKRGHGLRAIVKKANDEMLSSPNDKKLTRSVLHNAMLRGDFGVSPPKIGRKPVVPHTLTYSLATHSTMMQVSGDGEASASKMKAVASALMIETPHENAVNIDYLRRKTRSFHPEIMNPVKAKNNEDRRVDWLTYKNIHDWNARAKKFLIDVGMANDRPGQIRVWYYFIFFFLRTPSHLNIFPNQCRWSCL